MKSWRKLLSTLAALWWILRLKSRDTNVQHNAVLALGDLESKWRSISYQQPLGDLKSKIAVRPLVLLIARTKHDEMLRARALESLSEIDHHWFRLRSAQKLGCKLLRMLQTDSASGLGQWLAVADILGRLRYRPAISMLVHAMLESRGIEPSEANAILFNIEPTWAEISQASAISLDAIDKNWCHSLEALTAVDTLVDVVTNGLVYRHVYDELLHVWMRTTRAAGWRTAVLILTFQPLRFGIEGRIEPVSSPGGRVADAPDGESVGWRA